MGDFIHDLKASLHRGFINKQYTETNRYAPKLIINDTKENKAVLTSLLDELKTCKSFIFSVAFITESI